LTTQDFAVVLINGNLRGTDGSEVVGQICSQACARAIPVILMTGAVGPHRDLPKGCDGGTIERIRAPIEPEILRSRVRVLVELHQRRNEVRRLKGALQEASDLLERQQAPCVSENEAQLRAVFEHPTEITVVMEAERDSQGVIQDWVYRDA